MVEVTARSLAEHFSEGGRLNYEGSGHVAPIVFVLDERGYGFGLMPNEDGHPPDLFGRLVGFASIAIETRFVCAVTEAWIKEFPQADAPENIRRGHLERLHQQGDPTVKTTVMSLCIDILLSKPDKPWGAMLGVVEEGKRADGSIEWKVMEPMVGEQYGYLPDVLLEAPARAAALVREGYAVDRLMGPLGADPMDTIRKLISPEFWAEQLVKMGVASAVLLILPGMPIPIWTNEEMS